MLFRIRIGVRPILFDESIVIISNFFRCGIRFYLQKPIKIWFFIKLRKQITRIPTNSNLSMKKFDYHFIFIISPLDMLKIIKSLGVNHQLTKVIRNSIINHKFYFGQGGQLQFNLTRRKYQITIQTVWEDFTELELQGLTGDQNFQLSENQESATFHDNYLKDNQNQLITVKLKIPQDYTLNGIVNGSIIHTQGNVGSNLRSKPFSLTILGKSNQLKMGNVKSEQIKIQNQNGSVFFSGLTVQSGKIIANRIESKKMMTSQNIYLKGQLIKLTSLQMFGPSKGILHGESIDIESIAGESEIICKNLNVERYYAGNKNINIKCKEISKKISVQTGNGTIIFQNDQAALTYLQKIKLGRMHKGSISLMKNTVNIL